MVSNRTVPPCDDKRSSNNKSTVNNYKKSGYSIPAGTVSSTTVSETNRSTSNYETSNYNHAVSSRPYYQKSLDRPKKKKKNFHTNPYMDNLDSDEYDSDMDDFICDDQIEGADQVNYSKMIRKLTKYDPRKFKYESEYDIAQMENKSFKSIQKEESRSLRIAKQEDAIERERELKEAERKLKKLKKKMIVHLFILANYFLFIYALRQYLYVYYILYQVTLSQVF